MHSKQSEAEVPGSKITRNKWELSYVPVVPIRGNHKFHMPFLDELLPLFCLLEAFQAYHFKKPNWCELLGIAILQGVTPSLKS